MCNPLSRTMSKCKFIEIARMSREGAILWTLGAMATSNFFFNKKNISMYIATNLNSFYFLKIKKLSIYNLVQ